MNDADATFTPLLIEGKDLERHFALQDAMVEFARLFQDESNDRAMVIVGAAFLDTQLEHIITTFLVDDKKEIQKLLRPDQTLGTYGGKTRLAYCLGLIGANVRDDLQLIGKSGTSFLTTYTRRSRTLIFNRGSYPSNIIGSPTWHRTKARRSEIYSTLA